MTRYQRSEYILAAYEFSKLIKNMTASEFIPLSQFMLAECYYLLSPNFNLDQRYTKKAIEEYQAFIDFFPTNEKVSEAESKISELNEKLAQKEYSDALIYEKLEYYSASIMYYSNIIEVYHDTKYAPMAMYNKIVLLLERDRNNEAMAEINKFLSRFSSDERAEEVRQLKTSLEGKLSASK
jgi:outer membrane protein assembly factor BamD